MVTQTNIRKAAVLLMSLPEPDAATLIAKLSSQQVEAVSTEIAKLNSVSGDEQESVIREFAEVNPNQLDARSGGIDLAKALLERSLGSKASSTLDNIRQSIEALPFSFLQKVDSQNLLTFVVDEHPQTIALILSHIPPSQASEILAGIPPERQISVIRRIATMGQTSPEMIHEVEDGLERRMASVMSQSFENAGGVESVAEILNVIDRATERLILEDMAQDDPDLVEEIRRLMFVFDDIAKFSDRDIQAVLKNVDNSQWAVALKGASEELKERTLSNMSKNAADLLREEMEYLGPVRLSEVEQIQQQIVDIIRRLEDAGEVTIQTGDEEEEFIQ